MTTRARALVRRGIDAVLGRKGYAGADLELARGAVLDWARARARGVRGGRGFVGGLGVVVTRPGRAELVPLEAQLPAPGEVTVEILVSAISAGTERAQWLRLPNARPQLPFAPGYSGAGRVLAVGRGVDGVAPGDDRRGAAGSSRVRGHRCPPPGPCACPTACRSSRPRSSTWRHRGLRRAPGRLRPGDSVCVLGAGPIGALAHRLAALAGAGPVTVVATSRRREEEALRAGASAFLLVSDDLDGIGAAAVIEATGDPDAIGSAVAAARPGATVVLLGSPRGVSRASAGRRAPAPWPPPRGRPRQCARHRGEASRRDPFRELAETFLAGVAEGRLLADDLAGEAADPREIALLLPPAGAGRRHRCAPRLAARAR